MHAMAQLIRAQKLDSDGRCRVIAWDYDGPLFDGGRISNVNILRIFFRVLEDHGIRSVIGSARLREKEPLRAKEMLDLLDREFIGVFDRQLAEQVREQLVRPKIFTLFKSQHVAPATFLPILRNHSPTDTEKTWKLLATHFPRIFTSEVEISVKNELLHPQDPPYKNKGLLLATTAKFLKIPLSAFILVDDEASAYKTPTENESKCQFLHAVRDCKDVASDTRYLFALLECVCPRFEMPGSILKYVIKDKLLEKNLRQYYAAYQAHKAVGATLMTTSNSCKKFQTLFSEYFPYVTPAKQQSLTVEACAFLAMEEKRVDAEPDSKDKITQFEQIEAVYRIMFNQGVLTDTFGNKTFTYSADASLADAVAQKRRALESIASAATSGASSMRSLESKYAVSAATGSLACSSSSTHETVRRFSDKSTYIRLSHSQPPSQISAYRPEEKIATAWERRGYEDDDMDPPSGLARLLSFNLRDPNKFPRQGHLTVESDSSSDCLDGSEVLPSPSR
ncbi:hypothetical protein BH10PSE19_BH10PSE19_04710 [soil metagenome]